MIAEEEEEEEEDVGRVIPTVLREQDKYKRISTRNNFDPKNKISLNLRPTMLSLTATLALSASSSVVPKDVLPATFNSAPSPLLKGVVPQDALTHFCVITGWDVYNDTVS